MKDKRWVSMVCFPPSLVRKNKEDEATVMDAVEHIICAAEMSTLVWALALTGYLMVTKVLFTYRTIGTWCQGLCCETGFRNSRIETDDD